MSNTKDLSSLIDQLRAQYIRALRESKIAHDLAEESEDGEDYAQSDEDRGHEQGVAASLRTVLQFAGVSETDANAETWKTFLAIRDEPMEETRAHVD